MSRWESELRRAQAAFERGRRLLLFPSAANLESARPPLEEACAALRELAQVAGRRGAHDEELRAGLRALRHNGRRMTALLEGAARLHAGWKERLAAASAGVYTREGEPAEPRAQAGLSVEG